MHRHVFDHPATLPEPVDLGALSPWIERVDRFGVRVLLPRDTIRVANAACTLADPVRACIDLISCNWRAGQSTHRDHLHYAEHHHPTLRALADWLRFHGYGVAVRYGIDWCDSITGLDVFTELSPGDRAEAARQHADFLAERASEGEPGPRSIDVAGLDMRERCELEEWSDGHTDAAIRRMNDCGRTAGARDLRRVIGGIR